MQRFERSTLLKRLRMTQEKQRVKRIYARVTEEEYAQIQEQADVAAISISEFLRRRALGRKIAGQAARFCTV